MYITSSLFDAAASTSTTDWDVMAGVQQQHQPPPQAVGPGKKRRRDDSNDFTQTPRSTWSPSVSPKGSVYFSTYNNATPLRVSTSLFSPPSFHPLDIRPVKQLKRKKLASTSSTSNNFYPATTKSTPSSISESSESILKPCHICHKKPARRSDLQGYFDCQGCEERACQVCERVCEGCRMVVCSRCCTEVGEECESWCEDCEMKDWQIGGRRSGGGG